MTWEPAAVPAAAAVGGNEGVIKESHALSGEIGAEGVVEARVDHLAGRVEAYRVGFGVGGVDPRAAHSGPALEDDDAVPLASKLAGGGEAGGACTDDGHVAAEEGGGGRGCHRREARGRGRRRRDGRREGDHPA